MTLSTPVITMVVDTLRIKSRRILNLEPVVAIGGQLHGTSSWQCHWSLGEPGVLCAGAGSTAGFHATKRGPRGYLSLSSPVRRVLMRRADDFDAFYVVWAPRLVRSVYLSTGDEERAKDCVQEAFVRAWERWDRLDQDPVAWVRTVAWRLAAKDWRRRGNLARIMSRHWPSQEEPVDTTPVELLAVKEALAQLSTEMRTTVVLFYFEDLTVGAIAEVLRLPEGTVKARLSRARTALATLLEEREMPCRSTQS